MIVRIWLVLVGRTTVGLDTVAGLDSIGLDLVDLNSVGSSRKEGAGLVDGGLADAHGVMRRSELLNGA
jgi:hypothetical protein